MITLSLNTQTILASLSICLMVYYVIKRMRFRLPPGPWCIPLVGHYQIYSSVEMHKKVAELSKTYGPVLRLSYGSSTWVLLNENDVVIEALVKKKADFAGRPEFSSDDAFSSGGKDLVFSTYSPTWKLHRKIAGKALRLYLRGDLLENTVQNNVNRFLDKMALEEEPFAFKSYVDLMVFHQLYTISFGEKRPIEDPEVKALLKLDEELIAELATGFLEDLVPHLKDIYPTAKWKKFLRLIDQLSKVLRAKYKEHVNTFQPGVNRDFIDSLLMARQEAENEGDVSALEKFDDTRLIQTISDIILAGLDTSRFTMDWFVYFMSRFPEIQTKCQEEIERVVGSGHPSIKDLSNLDYTEACLFETMRLGSVVGLGIPHMTICDTQVGGYDIPKGTTVIINHWALHHDPKFFKDPENFDPYRYLDENGKMKPSRPDSWLPFSAGRRVCLGESLAKPEILMMCVNLLQRFEIRLPNGVKPNLEYKQYGFGTELPPEYKIIVKDRNKN
ncbi:steroid 17-alpha-hydroxylase/17,20 lyase-like [Saccostrea echinata]|uniref:steroid 17-alpha-hydroxylase/17,20 lyase-like n=1 Tax=Saccostrea echinata TaxID=191078 RepID=UPI002A836EF9|nr:steroid 17-alpha-hydroxylase/17,20 lyase-like [Saccostrea echinata]